MSENKDYLSADDFEVAELLEVIFGRSNRLSKALALQLLGRKVYPGKIDDLRRVLEDEKQEPKARYTAAIELGRTGANEAKNILLKSIKLKDPFVQRAVLESLGMMGEKEEFNAIHKFLQEQKDLPYARLAATQIAYRIGLKNYEMPFPQTEQFVELDPKAVQLLELEPVDETTAKECLEDISKSIPKMDFSPRLMKLKVGERDWLFLFNRKFFESKMAILSLIRRKSMFGIIATRFTHVHERWLPTYYIFTNPMIDKQLIQILVTTSNGTIAFAGTSEFAKRKLRFIIKTVKHPGARLLQIEGSFSKGALLFEKAYYQPGRLKASTPTLRMRKTGK